jgi:hypothetical protein
LAYAAFAVCAFINNLLLIEGFLSQISYNLQWEMPFALAVANFGVRLAFRLALIWLIIWRVSIGARWLVVVLALPWLAQLPSGIEALARGDMAWLPWSIAFFCLCTAIVCLFLPSARAWFRRKGHTIASDRTIFD